MLISIIFEALIAWVIALAVGMAFHLTLGVVLLLAFLIFVIELVFLR